MKSGAFFMVGAGVLVLVAIAVAGSPAPPQPPVPPKAVAKPESPEVRVARARLQLAEANLKRVEATNRKVARAVPESTVAEFRADLAVAKARLDLAIAGGEANRFQGWLRDAEAAAQSAHTQWQSAVEANRRTPRAVDPLDVERLRLRFELAHAQAQRGRTLTSKSPAQQAEWRLDVLADEVQRLKEALPRPTPVVRIYPIWPY